MSTVSSTTDASPDPNIGPDPERVTIKAPRGLWLDALMFFITFGFYAVFWLPARMSELKRSKRGDFRPWAWVFVPFFWIAQLIALPRFLRAWGALGKEYGVLQSPARTVIATSLVVSSNVFFLLTDLFESQIGFELPYYTLLIAWLALAMGYTMLAHAVREVISVLPPESFEKKQLRAGLGGFEWAAAIPLTPFAAFAAFGFLMSAFTGGSMLPADEVYEDEKAGFALTIHGDDWRLLPAGTFGDEWSSAEFQGPVNDQILVVYTHEPGSESIDSLVEWRVGQWVESGLECEETRRWSPSSASPVSLIECTADRIGGWQTLQLLKIIEHEERVIELIGRLEAASAVVERHRSDFVTTVQSLEVL